MRIDKIDFTISGSNDASQLDIFSKFDGATGFDPTRKEFGSGKFPEQSDLAEKFLTTTDVNGRRTLLNSENIFKLTIWQ